MINSLKCDVTSCAYNRNQCCRASIIQVRGENAYTQDSTFCSSFMQKGAYNMLSSVGNMNLLGGIGQLFNQNNTLKPKVSCSTVNCVHNDYGLCNADDLEIGGMTASSAEDTKCQSFQRKY